MNTPSKIMIKAIQRSCVFTFLLCYLMLSASQLVAQEVYFAEDPPMVLDGKQKRIPDFIIEYSAKNHGFITLELVQNAETVVGKSTFTVKKRGSNTAKMVLEMLHKDRSLAPGKNYQYRLTLYENRNSTTSSKTKSTNRMGLSTALVPSTKPEPKKVGETTIVLGVKVL